MPSTLGIVASHNNYQPPTFSIVPDKTTIKEGEVVTYTITTTNYNSPNVYLSNSGTAANADLNYIFSSTVPLVGGSATVAISALNDTAIEGPETLIVNLRTGSTTGPIVATASTVTINNMTPAYETGASYSKSENIDSGILSPSWKTFTTPTQPFYDGRWQRIQIVGGSGGSNYTSTIRTIDIFNSLNVRLVARSPVATTYTLDYKMLAGYYFKVTYSPSGLSSQPNVKIYRQTDASFAITG